MDITVEIFPGSFAEHRCINGEVFLGADHAFPTKHAHKIETTSCCGVDLGKFRRGREVCGSQDIGAKAHALFDCILDVRGDQRRVMRRT